MYKGERFNSITHLIGAILSLIGLIVLVVLVSKKGDVYQIVSFSIYGSSLFIMYIFSTLYHSFKGDLKKFFRIMDHNSIYFLTAGTYTPFTLVALKGAWGWSIFGIAWGLALTGIINELIPKHKYTKKISIALHLIMGWLIVIALRPLLTSIPLKAFILLLIGGLFYTGGLVFYLLDHKKSYFHGIWHLFVLAGSIFHYITIIGFLM